MYVFKSLTRSDYEFEESLTHADITLRVGDGVFERFVYTSASFTDASLNQFNKAGKHWNFLHHNYYSSGSSQISASDPVTLDQFSHNIWNNRGWEYVLQGQYRNKFYNTGTVFYVPQHYYGERIKPGSFELSATTASKTIVIKDDGVGNIYGYSGIEHSQSAATSISSSDNYLGNIFYDDGVINLTETGSWSGSSAIAEGFTYKNLFYTAGTDTTLNFQSSQPIFTKTWRVVVEPHEFNSTLNRSARAVYSGSTAAGQENIYDGNDWWASGWLTRRIHPNLEATSGSWTPHCTAIALYGEDTNIATSEPLVIAHLSQPIPMDSEVPIIFEISLDF